MFEESSANNRSQADIERQRNSHFHLLYHQQSICDQDLEQQHNLTETCRSSPSSGPSSRTQTRDSGLFDGLERSLSTSSNGGVVNVVAKRNARERTRVHTVNQAFMVLKTHIPEIRSHTKRVSKLKILRAAINHIDYLVRKLKADDALSHFSQPLLSKSVPAFSVCDTQLLNNPNFQPYVNVQTLLDYPSYIYPNASTAQQLLASHPLFLTQGYSSSSS
ncbi:unnamed protein product [Auanema sp. JU1783]|nr:unnamed protein product [Auanema sp. JU1783]